MRGDYCANKIRDYYIKRPFYEKNIYFLKNIFFRKNIFEKYFLEMYQKSFQTGFFRKNNLKSTCLNIFSEKYFSKKIFLKNVFLKSIKKHFRIDFNLKLI